MKQQKKSLFKPVVVLSMIMVAWMGPLLWGGLTIKTVDLERIELKLNDLPFNSLSNLTPVKDGYIFLIQSSFNSPIHQIAKVDKKGKLVTLYDRKGAGPGDLSNVHFSVTDDRYIYFSETQAPYVHKFTHDLKFVEDFRIKTGGNIYDIGNYYGIQSEYYNNNKIYIFALYDKKTFRFNRYAFEVKEIPVLSRSQGDICKVDDNTYAGIFNRDYQITLFDNEMRVKKKLINKIPPHIKPYIPFPKKLNQQYIDKDEYKWYFSWAKMIDIKYWDGILSLTYHYQYKPHVDYYSASGVLLKVGNEGFKSITMQIHTDGYSYYFDTREIDDETTQVFLVKQKVIITK